MRLTTIAEYFQWFANHMISRPSAIEANQNYKIETQIKSRRPSKKGRNKTQDRSLDDIQLESLFEVIRIGSQYNPFIPEIQRRNRLFILLLYHLGIRCGELLNIKIEDINFSKNQLHGNRGYLPIELYKPTNNFFSNDLSPRESLEKQHKSIFDRYNYFSEKGERLKISHQARHLLNTIAQRGGLSNLEIAKWFGRADVKQNRIYNHMTDYEMVAIAERIDTSKTMFGPIGNLETPLPVTTQEFNALEQAAIHITEYGYCVHDYTMSPREKYRDCINCTEQVCIKGDSSKLERIKERLEKTEKLLLKVEKDVKEGDIGADRWLSYHQKTATRLNELIRILENPKIENGAQIKLRGNDFSQLRRVAEKKRVKSIKNSPQNDEEALILKNLTKMLGGKFG